MGRTLISFEAATKTFSLPTLATCIAMSLLVTGRAQIVNGGFETGSAAGWSIAGQAGARDASFGVVPTHGSWAGYLENTGNGTVLAGDMETALHLPTGTVTNFVSGTPTRGTVMWQNVTVSAGQILVFDWNFMSDELNEAPVYDDFAFFSVVGAISGVTDSFLLASRNSSSFTAGAPAGFDGLTGWSTRNYTFTASDTYRIGFGVMNVTDGGHNSALMLDAISVPEPATVALIGMCALLLARRLPSAGAELTARSSSRLT
jgi:hypothetical protein